VSEEAERYGQLIRRLAAQAPYQLFLSDEACARMEELRRRLHEIEQAAGGLAEGFQGFVGKLPGVAGNLALILTLVANRNAGEVSAGTIGNVATIIEDFILPHAHEFYAGSAVSEPLQRLTSWILTSGKDRIVPSDLTVNVRDLRGSGLWDLNQKLSPLIAGGWLTPEEPGPTARAWTVNSAVHELFRTRAEEEERRKAAMAKLMNSPRKSRREQ
jgi:hypothetical protein